MSRYESSRFVKDPKTMNKEILKAACEKLGWTYKVQGEDLIVTANMSLRSQVQQ